MVCGGVVAAIFGGHSVWEFNDVWVRHRCGIWMSVLKVRTHFWKFIWFKLG